VNWKPYTVEWSPAAQRDIRRLDAALVQRIARAVDRYAATGQGDVKTLQDAGGERRLRVGEWRVRFTLDDAVRVLLVLRVLPRGSAYKD
jgi:mRNA interferase RelE/StbE